MVLLSMNRDLADLKTRDTAEGRNGKTPNKTSEPETSRPGCEAEIVSIDRMFDRDLPYPDTWNGRELVASLGNGISHSNRGHHIVGYNRFDSPPQLQLRRGRQPTADGKHRGLRAILHPKLFKDRTDVISDGPFRKIDPRGNLSIG
jgi:hypothetical protein